MANQYTIQELVLIAKGNDEELKKNDFEFGRTPNALARQISQDTGINIIGAMKVINPFGIFHVIKYHSTEEEYKRHQIPVSDTDYDHVPDIVNNFDSYELAAKDQRGNPGIYYKKRIGDIIYFVCMTYTHEKDRYTKEIYNKRLTLSTMYKKHIKHL